MDRTNVPVDKLDFYFNNFAIQPGQQLSLHFDMSDFCSGNTWRFNQVPTVPEPATYGLWLVGLGAVGLVSLRRRSD